MAGGRGGCLEITSEPRDEMDREEKLWQDKWERWMAGGGAEGATKTPREKREER